MTTTKKEIGGPSSLSFWQNMKEPYAVYFHQLMKEYGDVVYCGFHIYLVSHPDHARHILHNDLENYEKSDLISRRMQVIFGKGIMTSNGASWLGQRRILHPFFNRQGTRKMLPAVLETIDRYLDGWEKKAASGAVVNLVDEFTDLSLIMAASAFFNADISGDVKKISALVETGNHYVINTNPVFIPSWIPTRGNLRIRRVIEELDAILQKRIPRQTTTSTMTGETASNLVKAISNSSGSVADQQLVADEIRTLLISGSSTIAAALSNCWQLLSGYPDQLPVLYKETAQKNFDLSILKDPADEFPFTMQLILESLRLYPAAYVMWRKCTRQDEFDGYRIPKGASVMISIFNMHRHPGCWDDPELFDPSRFNKAANEKRPRHYFMPFGWGPRQCMGDSFSLWALPMVMVRMLQRFDFTLLPGQLWRLRHAPAIIPEKVDVIIRSKAGIK